MVGGLGIGFTLRAALDLLPAAARSSSSSCSEIVGGTWAPPRHAKAPRDRVKVTIGVGRPRDARGPRRDHARRGQRLVAHGPREEQVDLQPQGARSHPSRLRPAARGADHRRSALPAKIEAGFRVSQHEAHAPGRGLAALDHRRSEDPTDAARRPRRGASRWLPSRAGDHGSRAEDGGAVEELDVVGGTTPPTTTRMSGRPSWAAPHAGPGPGSGVPRRGRDDVTSFSTACRAVSWGVWKRRSMSTSHESANAVAITCAVVAVLAHLRDEEAGAAALRLEEGVERRARPRPRSRSGRWSSGSGRRR